MAEHAQLAPHNLSDDKPDELSLSQQSHRRVIGILGFFLPVAIYVLAGLRTTVGLPPWQVLDSVSAYYYTGAVGVLVGVLFALSLFLATYRGYAGARAESHHRQDRGRRGAFGGPLPDRSTFAAEPPSWWSQSTSVLHYVAAVVLFGSFILFSVWLFRKSDIPDKSRRPPEKQRRDNACLACGIVMIGAVIWAIVAGLTDRPIFVPEAIAIEAFAISWLVKSETHRAVGHATKTLVHKMTGG